MEGGNSRGFCGRFLESCAEMQQIAAQGVLREGWGCDPMAIRYCFARLGNKQAGSSAAPCRGKLRKGEIPTAFAEGLWGALGVLECSG